MENTQKIYNLIILDESGSMSSIYAQALSGVNETINGIRINSERYPEQEHFVSIVTFEGNGLGGVKLRRCCEPIASIRDLDRRDYVPGGATPLYDAIGKSVSELERRVREGDKVLVTIITDGYENSSVEYSSGEISRTVARLRRNGWTFAYIGANQDSVEVAKGMNIRNAMNYEATPSGTIQMSVKYRSAQDRLFKSMHHKEERASDCPDFFEEN